MSEDQLTGAAEREMDLYRNEVARITAERDKYREQLNEVLDWFHGTGSGYTARISGVRLAREYTRAGIPVPERLRHLEGQ